MRVLRAAAWAPAIVFVLIGVGWLVVPATVGGVLGMSMLDGVGLSTQIGDLASFFLTTGGCVALGLKTGQRLWLFPAIMLIGLAAFGRLLAWGLHGAALAADMIAVEVILVGWLVAIAREPEPPRSTP